MSETQAAEVKKPGHVDSLDPEQEGKLKEIWQLFLKHTKDANVAELHAIKGSESKAAGESAAGADDMTSGGKDAAKKQAKSDAAKSQEKQALEARSLDQLLSEHGSKAMKRAFWEYTMNEDPDALMLRYLRARQWDPEKAFHMLAATIKWRIETDVAGIIAMGEEGLCKSSGIKKNFELGKCYYRGTDRQGRPVVFAHAKHHKASDQTQEEMLKFLVFNMETAKTIQPIRAPTETASVVIDLAGFGLSNMDWDTATTVIKVFESYYPESLGHAVLWNAPTVFSAAWRIVKPMLDPVVREKITFASSATEIDKVIDVKQLARTFDGQSSWGYRFKGPQAGENDHMKDEEEVLKRTKAYFAAAGKYEEATETWISSGKNDDRKGKIFKKLIVRMIDLDPYIRGKTQFSRDGTQVGDGRVVWRYDHGRTQELGESVQPWAEEANIEDPAERPHNGNSTEDIALSSDEDTVSSTSDSEAEAIEDPHHHHHNAVTVGFAKVGDGIANGFSKLTPGPSLHAKRKALKEERHKRHEAARARKLEEKRKRIEAERQRQEELEEDRIARERKEEEEINSSYIDYVRRVGSLSLSATNAVADYVPAVLGGNILKKVTSPSPSEATAVTV